MTGMSALARLPVAAAAPEAREPSAASGGEGEAGLRAILEQFDLAYQTSWPAEPGQFWADRYPAFAAPYANLVHARNARVVALCPPGEALLDIGCGYADLLYQLRDKYRVLRGVDPSKTCCAMATYNLALRKVGNDYACVPGVAEDLPFADGAFDTAILLDTFEHIQPASRDAALREARRVLKPSGRLVLVTPSRFWLRAMTVLDGVLTLRSQLRMRRRKGTPVNLWRFPVKDYCEEFCSRRELHAALRRAGFRVEHHERVSFYPAPERGGYFYRFFERWPAGDPRHAQALAIVRFFERLGWFSQKMLVVATPKAGVRP
jgi:ubiquinone/menaquinone biosynthesis C-methylase UbiE